MNRPRDRQRFVATVIEHSIDEAGIIERLHILAATEGERRRDAAGAATHHVIAVHNPDLKFDPALVDHMGQ
ncbi:MAG: hypothetical protein R2867_36540 [Caldilineaceae bacterium]